MTATTRPAALPYVCPGPGRPLGWAGPRAASLTAGGEPHTSSHRPPPHPTLGAPHMARCVQGSIGAQRDQEGGGWGGLVPPLLGWCKSSLRTRPLPGGWEGGSPPPPPLPKMTKICFPCSVFLFFCFLFISYFFLKNTYFFKKTENSENVHFLI